MAAPLERWSWVSFALLALMVAGCQPPGAASKPAAGPPPPPEPPAGVGVVLSSDVPAGIVAADDEHSPDTALDSAASAAAGVFSGAAALAPNLSSDEAAVQRLFSENLELSRSTDGKRILERCHPDLRSEVIVGMAQFGYFLLGPDSEAGRMIAEAGLLGERFQPLFDDLKDHQLDSPASRALADEAAGKIADPARLVTLVRQASVGRMPETTCELVDLTVEGDAAAGVCLMVTRQSTQATPFAAERIGGTWYAARPTPAALAKVKNYEANPTGATVKLPPRKEVRVTAEQLAAEFQSDPAGASRKYGFAHQQMGPIGPMGPMGPAGPRGPFGPGGHAPFGPQGIIVQPGLPPAPPDHDTVLVGTVAYRTSIARRSMTYLVTPPGLPAVSLAASDDEQLSAVLAAAESGQTVRAVVMGGGFTSTTEGGPGHLSVACRQVQVEGEPAEPLGPFAAADFVRELVDPLKVAKYQGRPVILTGTAVMSQPQGLMVGLSDGGRGMVGCVLQPSERKALQAVKRGQAITVRGTYIQPHGRNQLMLQGTVLIE